MLSECAKRYDVSWAFVRRLVSVGERVAHRGETGCVTNVSEKVVARCARRRRVVGEVARREMSQHSERERRGTRTERERGRGEREPGELLTSSLTEIFRVFVEGA